MLSPKPQVLVGLCYPWCFKALKKQFEKITAVAYRPTTTTTAAVTPHCPHPWTVSGKAPFSMGRPTCLRNGNPKGAS